MNQKLFFKNNALTAFINVIHYSPFLSIMIIIIRVLLAALPTVQILATSKFIDTAQNIYNGLSPLSDVYIPIGIVVAVIAFSWLSNEIIKLFAIKQKNDVAKECDLQIMHHIGRLHYKYIEDADSQSGNLRMFEKYHDSILNTFYAILDIMNLIVRILGIIFILMKISLPSIFLIILCTIPLMYLSIKSGKSQYEAEFKSASYHRRANYLSQILLDKASIEERYMFGFSEEINLKYVENYNVAKMEQIKAKRKWFVKSKLSSFMTTFIIILVTFILLQSVFNGLCPVSLFISLMMSLIELIYMIAVDFSVVVDRFAQNIEFLKEAVLFFEKTVVSSDETKPAQTITDFHELEFINVSFRYQGTDRYILKNLSFKIEEGFSYGFVGENGAGKTTIIKLISGLYKDYEGTILIDGVDLKMMPSDIVKSKMTIIFQDFAKYPLSVQENILISDLSNEEVDNKFVHTLLEDLGMTDVVAALPMGVNTQLSKLDLNGWNISGGEWQRIAIARALYKSAPLQILDEPTASLDPISESNLYQLFKKIAASNRKTTILITHRLGSAKIVDKLFVLHEGTIVETGTHDELIESKGMYERMYTSQRSWYK